MSVTGGGSRRLMVAWRIQVALAELDARVAQLDQVEDDARVTELERGVLELLDAALVIVRAGLR